MVQKVRESKSKQVKPANQCTKMTLEKRAKVLSSKSLSIINNQALQIYHPEDKLTLKTLEFSGQISRDAYCKLAATEQFYHENGQCLMNANNFDSEIVQKVINAIGTRVQRSAKDILLYIIPKLMYKNVLQSFDPIIHLRISGDGRNIGRKIKQVMVTIMILNNRLHHHHPDYHYTTILYPGTEKYETLHFALSLFLDELRVFKNEG
ncbi:41268_t:CDS:2 [Gigaspora margarita]|uniref:41268_t:CDS:1 n=1 Tax=Gigaspora margarita TaxID=4874 RepID=A0ABN7UC22_GIGMA|nr:41268_t:CDS:2 [Gigaspora margarita]